MKKSKVLAAALAAAMVATSMAACGSSDNGSSSNADNNAAADQNLTEAGAAEQTEANAAEEEAITCKLLVWSPSEDQAEDQGAWLQTMCDKFNEEHPNWDITFEYGTVNEAEAGPMIVQDPEASADVFLYANDTLATLVPANGVAKIGGQTEEWVKETNSEAMVDSLTVDGYLYGIPFTSNTWFMYYDKSVFSEDDIKSLNTMLEKGTVSFPLVNSWYLPAFYVANGCTFFGDGTDEAAGIDWSGDKATQVTDFLVDLMSNDNFTIDDQGSGLSGIRDGSIKAMFSGSWDYNAVKEALGDNFGCAQLPTVDYGDGAVQMKSFFGTKAVGVNPNCEYPQVAVALAKYLASPDAQKLHYELRAVVPSNLDLLQDADIQADPLVKAQNDTVANTSILQPYVPAMDNYWTNGENLGKAIRSGEVTHANAAEMTENANTAMNTSVVE